MSGPDDEQGNVEHLGAHRLRQQFPGLDISYHPGSPDPSGFIAGPRTRSSREVSAMTIVEFYSARLDEDEQVARWIIKHGCWDGIYVESANLQEAEHIARHDPARVLREVEAKRAILDRYAEHADYDDVDNSYEHATGRIVGLGEAVRLLALEHADHEEYREEWRP